MIYDIYELRYIAEIEFSDIIGEVVIEDINEIRLFLYEDSFIDVWFSLKLENRYSYHWERVNVDGFIYRHDNAPHESWKNIKTFPKHFHNRNEPSVEESLISDNLKDGLREFLYFVRDKVKKNES